MNPTRTLVLIPAVAIALAAGGCGSSEDNDFIESYNAATKPLTELSTSLSGAPNEQSLDKMASGLEDVKGKLAALDAPDDAQDELDALVASIDANTAEVRKMAKAVKSQDVEQLTAAAESFSAEGQKLVQAEEALRAAVEG
jgi:aminoglycoside phosphotransferase family enzyme